MGAGGSEIQDDDDNDDKVTQKGQKWWLHAAVQKRKYKRISRSRLFAPIALSKYVSNQNHLEQPSAELTIKTDDNDNPCIACVSGVSAAKVVRNCAGKYKEHCNGLGSLVGKLVNI